MDLTACGECIWRTEKEDLRILKAFVLSKFIPNTLAEDSAFLNLNS